MKISRNRGTIYRVARYIDQEGNKVSIRERQSRVEIYKNGKLSWYTAIRFDELIPTMRHLEREEPV